MAQCRAEVRESGSVQLGDQGAIHSLYGADNRKYPSRGVTL